MRDTKKSNINNENNEDKFSMIFEPKWFWSFSFQSMILEQDYAQKKTTFIFPKSPYSTKTNRIFGETNFFYAKR